MSYDVALSSDVIQVTGSVADALPVTVTYNTAQKLSTHVGSGNDMVLLEGTSVSITGVVVDEVSGTPVESVTITPTARIQKVLTDSVEVPLSLGDSASSTFKCLLTNKTTVFVTAKATVQGGSSIHKISAL